MPFDVPAEDDAAYSDQSELDPIDLKIMNAGQVRTGVISGCVVSPQGTPDDTVEVASGVYAIEGTYVTCAGGTVNVLSGAANPDGSTVTAADATYWRYDLIVGDASGDLGVIAGDVPAPAWPSYAVNPKFPDFDPSVNVVLGVVFVPPTAASITGISANELVEKDLGIDITETFEVIFSSAGPVVVTTEADDVYHWTNDTGRTLTFESIRARAEIGPSGSTMTLDGNVEGTTIMTGTKVVLPDNTGAVSTVKQTTFSTTTVADGEVFSVNVDTDGGGAVEKLLVIARLKG